VNTVLVKAFTKSKLTNGRYQYCLDIKTAFKSRRIKYVICREDRQKIKKLKRELKRKEKEAHRVEQLKLFLQSTIEWWSVNLFNIPLWAIHNLKPPVLPVDTY